MVTRHDRWIAAGGLAVLATGFLPWWTVREAVNDSSETLWSSAWQISTRWSEAIALAAAGPALWLVWRVRRGRVPLPLRLAVLGGVAAAVFLTVQQWQDVERWPPPGSTIHSEVRAELLPAAAARRRPPVEDTVAASWMQRDELRSYHQPGLYVNFGWGLYAGLAAMLFVAAAVITAGDDRPKGTDVAGPSDIEAAP